jgi:hypothetical protein
MGVALDILAGLVIFFAALRSPVCEKDSLLGVRSCGKSGVCSTSTAKHIIKQYKKKHGRSNEAATNIKI